MNAFSRNLNNNAAQKLHVGPVNSETSYWDSFTKKLGIIGRNGLHICKMFVHNLKFAAILAFTYAVALTSVALLLGALLWGVYTFLPLFFQEYFGELDKVTVLLDGVPMLYQGIVAVLTSCLCVYVGRPYCMTVLAIQNCLISKNYAGIKQLLLDMDAHTDSLIHNAAGFILKCATATAVVYFIWQALKQM